MNWKEVRYEEFNVFNSSGFDLSTLKGTFWMVGTDYDAANDELADGFDKFGIILAGQLSECLKQENVPE
jgi:hypothetical protein